MTQIALVASYSKQQSRSTALGQRKEIYFGGEMLTEDLKPNYFIKDLEHIPCDLVSSQSVSKSPC
jgi:hypothetical protein